MLLGQLSLFSWHVNDNHTELAKKVCPRLRDSACLRSGEITQSRTHFFGQEIRKFCGHHLWKQKSTKQKSTEQDTLRGLLNKCYLNKN